MEFTKSTFKLIILDGLGINCKSSVLSRLSDKHPILYSNSDKYINSKCKDIFPDINKPSNKIQMRYLELMSAISEAKLKGFNHLIVDRGLLNQVIWASLLKDEIVDDYLQLKDDYNFVISHASDYINLESGMKIDRILIETQNDRLLNYALDYTRDDLTEHDQFRIDTYYDPVYYKIVQSEYLKRYTQLCDTSQITSITLTNKFESVDCIINYLMSVVLCKIN